jgi:SAM-dependent methyltransferase
MHPEDYDAWYASARGRWIGATEYGLLENLLHLQSGATLLDVGCGTGYFTRRFANSGLQRVVGLDPDRAWLEFAQAHRVASEQFVVGSALTLPFPDACFDYSIAVTALCFVPDQARAVREMLRVTRRRFALGLLNRHSLLYLAKGRGGGSGAYRGARWDTVEEMRALFRDLPVTGLEIATAVFFPFGAGFARVAESWWRPQWPWGSFIAVAGEIGNQENLNRSPDQVRGRP